MQNTHILVIRLRPVSCLEFPKLLINWTLYWSVMLALLWAHWLLWESEDEAVSRFWMRLIEGAITHLDWTLVVLMGIGGEPGRALPGPQKGKWSEVGGGGGRWVSQWWRLWDGEGHTQPHSLCASNPPSQHSFGQVSSWKCHEITTFFLSSQ